MRPPDEASRPGETGGALYTMEIGPDGGHPAFLVPGNDLCAEFYTPLARAMARGGIRTTLSTLPGYHGVPPLPQPSWDEMVRVVGEAARPDAAAGVTLIGHSMGALLALSVVARRPRWVERLVLLEPALSPSKQAARLAARKYHAEVVASDRGQFSNGSGPIKRVHDLGRFPRRAIDLYIDVRRSSDIATATALVGELPDRYPLPFEEIGIPTLVIVGASAGWNSRLAAYTARRKLRDVRVKVIDGAAHWLANEKDAAVAAAIDAFRLATSSR